MALACAALPTERRLLAVGSGAGAAPKICGLLDLLLLAASICSRLSRTLSHRSSGICTGCGSLLWQLTVPPCMSGTPSYHPLDLQHDLSCKTLQGISTPPIAMVTCQHKTESRRIPFLSQPAAAGVAHIQSFSHPRRAPSGPRGR